MAAASLWSLFALLACLSLASLSRAAPSNLLVTNLPGLNKTVNFTQYAGYVNLPGTQKYMFFWFVQSQRSPTKDPLLLWLNGGPGCSSMLGFLQEHGPFRPVPGGKDLALYPWAWNRIANIIYLEAPVGVGFSYSNDKSDYITNDTLTAADNYAFLKAWLALFPEFAANDFYVTGESYAGHYVPELANLILDGILDNSFKINMKGILVGNPAINDDWWGASNEYAYVSMLYSHAIIPQSVYTRAFNACGWYGLLVECQKDYKDPSPQCRDATNAALAYVPPVMDGYDVYAPVCLSPGQSGPFSDYVSGWHFTSKIPGLSSRLFEPCIENWLTDYLNDPAVQQAIHVQPTKWAYCGGVVYEDETQDMGPYYARLLTSTNWRMLIYSGDVDSAVPTVITQRFVDCLDQKVVKDWRPWYYNNQTAGFLIDYERGLTFETIKGAGHMVPWYLPEQGYAFFQRWLEQVPQ